MSVNIFVPLEFSSPELIDGIARDRMDPTVHPYCNRGRRSAAPALHGLP